MGTPEIGGTPEVGDASKGEDTPLLGVVIPALNEGETIAPVLTRVREYGMPIVVDDGSTDNTAELSRSLGAQVVSHKTNKGYDGALQSGFEHADKIGCKYVITIDADGQLPTDLIPVYLQHLQEGADMVVGIRDHVPRISERVFQIMALRLYGLQDPLCGMKGYDLRFFRELGHFDSYKSIGTELMLTIVRQKAEVREVNVPTKLRDGEARIGGNLKANYIIGRAAALAFLHHFTRS